MLKNQTESDQEFSTKLKRRVTPDEFSAALAAIQKRKAEQERILAETVGVDEVVKDLNLDATPDEILDEVEAQRRLKTQARTPRPPLGQVPTNTVPAFLNPQVYKSKTVARTRFEGIVTTIAITIAVVGVSLSYIFGKGFHPGSKEFNEPLSVVREQHPVTITNSELNQLIHGAAPSTITVTEGDDVLHDAPWTIVLEDGKYYIWAYANDPLPSLSDVILYNAMGDVPTDDASTVTVPISSLSQSTVAGEGEHGTIDVHNLKLDNHKDDEWVSN